MRPIRQARERETSHPASPEHAITSVRVVVRPLGSLFLLVMCCLVFVSSSLAAGSEPGEAPRTGATSRTDDAARLRNDTLLPPQFRQNVRLSWGANEYLVAGDGPDGVVACRVDADGHLLDEIPLQVDRRGQVRSVAFDGTNYFVVYVDDPRAIGYGSILYGRRIASTGDGLRLLDPSPIRIANAEFPRLGWIYNASVAFGGEHYLVAWSRDEGAWGVATIRVGRDGSVLGYEIPVDSPTGREEQPDVAWDGSRFLLVWTSGTTIEGAFVDPLSGIPGEVIRFSPLRSEPVPPSFVAVYPGVACSGTACLVAWSEGLWQPAHWALAGVSVSPAGEVVGAVLQLPSSDESQSLQEMTWDGRSFLLSWNEGVHFCTIDPCELPRFAMRSVRVEAEDAAVARPSEVGGGILTSHASSPDGRALFAYLVPEGVRIGLGRGEPRPRPVRRSAAPFEVPACTNPAPLLGLDSRAFPGRDPDEYIVRLHEGIDTDHEAQRLAATYGFQITSTFQLVSAFSANLSAATVAKIRCEASVASVEFAQTNIPPP